MEKKGQSESNLLSNLSPFPPLILTLNLSLSSSSQAKDPQIPGLLVHNEWRGTFEEFEEAVEFGELNLFLNIDPSRSLPPIPTQASTTPATQPEPSTSTSTSSVKLKPMPTAMPQMAPAGSGKRAETAEDLMASLSVELDEFNLSESDVSTLLEEMELEAQADRSARSIKSSEETSTGESKDQNGLGSRSISTSSSSSSKIGLGQPPPRTYIPSSDAGVKPLRFARMGSGNMEPQSMTDRASSINLNRSPTDSNSSSISSSNRSSSMFSSNSNADARYSTSSRSTKALAAEASALASSRNFSSKSFKESMKSGKDLQDALRSASSSSKNHLDQHVVGKETAEDLLASLGLGDLDLTEEEAEKFLLDGEVPDGLDESGYRFKESKKNHLNKADRAREEVAAREVAQRARDRGHLPRDSTGSRSSIITTGSSKSNASNGKEETTATPQEVSEVKDVVEEEKKKDVETKNEAEEKKDLKEQKEVEEKKDVSEGKLVGPQDVTAVETSTSSEKASKEQTVEPEVKDESQDTVIQPLNQQDLTASETEDLSSTPAAIPTSPLKASDDATPSGVVSAAPQDQDRDQDPTPGKSEADSEKVLDSTSTAQDQKAEVMKENDAESSKKTGETVTSLPADSVIVSESSESAAASESKPSIETPIAQSLEDESLSKLDPEEIAKEQNSSAAETSSATTDPASTANTTLEEKTPKGVAAELQSAETEQPPSSTPSTELSLPTNANSISLSSRKGSLSAVQTDLPRSCSSGSDKLGSSKSSNLPSDAPPVSPSASKALAVSTSSSSLSNGERRKRSGSGAGGGPTTPTSGRRALDFRRSEGPSSPLSPGSASGRRSNAASPPPMPPLPRSLSQMSKSESNGSSISINNNNNSTSPSSYTSPPISPGPDGKPLKKKRSMSLPRFGKKDKETKEREKEEKEEKKKAKKVGLNSPINSPVTSPVGGRSGGGGGHQRTISDILREADAAMNGDLDLDDDLDLDATGTEEEPDDGLGPAELPDDEDAPVRA